MSEPTESEIRKLRRLVCETGEDSAYTDEMLVEYLEEAKGSLYWAASDICREKAAAYANLYDFSADGGTYKRGDLTAKWLKLADSYQALGGKRSGGTIRLVKWPHEDVRGNVLESGTDCDA